MTRAFWWWKTKSAHMLRYNLDAKATTLKTVGAATTRHRLEGEAFPT